MMLCRRRRNLQYWGPVQRATRPGSSSGDDSEGWDVFPRLFGPVSSTPSCSPPLPPVEIVLNRWTQCYLEDAASTCAACWITSGKDGGVLFGGCPPEISIQWDREPPKQMFANVDYEVAYTVRIGAGIRRAIVKQDNVDLPHANIHSCFPTAGACTPFIQNTPGLATHTNEQEANLRADGATRFTSVINLPENRYTMIAHARFFVPSPLCRACATSPDCLNKIDMAIGEQRRLTKAPPQPPVSSPPPWFRSSPPPWFPTRPSSPSSGPPPRCYLDATTGWDEDEDDEETLCPVCWETPTNNPSTKAKIVHCPPGFELAWIKAPPKQLDRGKAYDVSFMVDIGDKLENLEAVQGFDISHANIHSCFASVEECTPSIADTPGLATHTDAQKDNVNRRGGTAYFMSKLPQLPPGEYTVIAHVRFFLREQGGNFWSADERWNSNGGVRDGLMQYDAAIGLKRTVVGPTVPPGPPLPSGPPPRCYLDATGGEEDGDETLCPVCWETPTNDPSTKAKIVHCPPGFELDWIKAPPKQLERGTAYDVSYMVRIGDEFDNLEAVQGFDISHANIHSCFASVEECTPSIADTPGLATHTDAQDGNLNRRGSTVFTSKISQLPPGEYTVIAHVRFFLRGGGNIWAAESSAGVRDGLMQYDAAIGLRRTVTGPSPDDDPPRCYLDAIAEDTAEDDGKEQETLCPVCWETPTNDPSTKAKIVHCPPGFELDWIKAPPKQLDGGKEYDVSYMVRIGDEFDNLEAVQGFDISHANIHSCFASVEECTPSIADTPGLATHTDAQDGNLNRRGSTAFMSKISQLPPGEYMVIAHVRFFLREDGNILAAKSSNGIRDGLVQYDAAIGLRRTVTGPSPDDDPPRCYLDAIADDEAEDGKEQETLCPVCWETPTNDPSTKAKIVHCPPGFELDWIKPPPQQLDRGKEYDVSYMVDIGDKLENLEAVQGFDISHANIHSCFASVEECTPSIADTPGLATHTDAQEDNVNWRGSTAFMSKLPQLPPGEYMVIAHVRFFLREDGINDLAEDGTENDGEIRDGLMQYDAAIGLRRTVKP